MCFDRYIFDIQAETHGITSRKWQTELMVGMNIAQAIGSAVGAAVAALVAPKSSGNNNDNDAVKTRNFATFVVFVGEFVGASLCMTVFQGIYISRRRFVQEAKDEERFYQHSMTELMTMSSILKDAQDRFD